MQRRSFPVAPNSLIAAISTYLRADGQELAAKIISSAFVEVVQTEFDNWNGGTYYYCLQIHIAQEDFVSLGFESIQTLQDIICGKLNAFEKPYPNQCIRSVSITPTLTADMIRLQGHALQDRDVSTEVLKFIALSEKRAPGVYVDDAAIAQELGLGLQDVQDWIDLFEEEGKVTTANSFAGYSALLTAKGRFFLKGIQSNPQVNAGKQDMRSTDPTKGIHIHTGGGAVVFGDVNTGGNFVGRDDS